MKRKRDQCHFGQSLGAYHRLMFSWLMNVSGRCVMGPFTGRLWAAMVRFYSICLELSIALRKRLDLKNIIHIQKYIKLCYIYIANKNVQRHKSYIVQVSDPTRQTLNIGTLHFFGLHRFLQV
jgi:hypothetical protein